MKNKPFKYTASIAILGMVMQTTPVFASPVTQGQIDNTQKHIENLDTTIQKLDNKISLALEKSQKLNLEIKTQEGKIQETKGEIDVAQKSLEAHKKAYSERLLSIQLQGQQSVLTYAEILFSSEGVSDFFSRATALSVIMQRDSEIMNGLKDKQQELTVAKEKLDVQLTDLKTKEEELASQEKKIEADKLEVQKQLEASKKMLKKQKKELTKQEARLEAKRQAKLLARQEAKRQAELMAQEEARLLEQQQAQQAQQTLVAINNESTTLNPVSSRIYSSDKAQVVIETAKKYMGIPYVWGGTTPNGFDCSGLTSYVYRNAVGVELPRVSRDQQNAGTRISPSQVQPGDLVFKGYPAYHVGIYIGGGQYIHAPHTGDVVKISSYNPSTFTTASRILN